MAAQELLEFCDGENSKKYILENNAERAKIKTKPFKQALVFFLKSFKVHLTSVLLSGVANSIIGGGGGGVNSSQCLRA